MYTLGIDIGSSSIKVSLLNISKNITVAGTQSPKEEMSIHVPQKDWAEQDPEIWITHLQKALHTLSEQNDLSSIQAIGISYQMHGLVMLDKNGKVLRPAIIWCDSRAVSIGVEASKALGQKYCSENLLNSPGNFTASKLKWVQEHEPEIYGKIHKIMLPGDYIVYRLTGNIQTTISGLSEAILWDFKEDKISAPLLEHFGIKEELLPEILPTFSVQGKVNQKAVEEFGLPLHATIAYRAGDQPNNAFSLKVLEPGEFAATAGTSGVVYGVNDQVKSNNNRGTNTFIHINHNSNRKRLGELLCINATGIANAWIRKMIAPNISYNEINTEASTVAIGSNELLFYPFGNGAERMLGNQNIGASLKNLDLNRHHRAHLLRAVQEGIAFSFAYGMGLMQSKSIKVIRVGNANLFLSEIFTNTLAAITGARIEFYNTDGATGAARGAAYGAGLYATIEETFSGLKQLKEVSIDESSKELYLNAYQNWLTNFDKTHS